MKIDWIVIGVVILLIFSACNTTKNIPEGSYLLNKVSLKNDTRDATADLETFLKQHPNSNFLVFGKSRLGIYNLVKNDTSKWINRTLMKLGEAPVIYSPKQTGLSIEQLTKQLNNEGYLNAKVDTASEIKGKKINITYHIKGGTPYRIRNYTYTIKDSVIQRIMMIVPLKPLIKEGDFFDQQLLEEEKLRVNKIMRNAGYYHFSKEYVFFKADTSLNSNQVDLYLNIYPPKNSTKHNRYKLNNIHIIAGGNAIEPRARRKNQNDTTKQIAYFRNQDTTYYKNLAIIRGRNFFLRNSTIYQNNSLRKGERYTDYKINSTYESFNKMGAVKQVNIVTKPSLTDSSAIDATVVLTRANAHSVRATVDGTNSAGDFGIAPSITYQHQNLFNGSELLNIKLKGAYEYLRREENDSLKNQSFYEYGIETGLSFPMFLFPFLKKSWKENPSASTRISIGLISQNRPQYTRRFFNTSLAYNWYSDQNVLNRNTMNHNLELIDINYVFMPKYDPLFQKNYLEKNVLLEQSYKDQLIQRTSYTFTYLNPRRLNHLQSTYVFRASGEVAGLIPRLVTSPLESKYDKYGAKTIFGSPYAEYIKGIIEYSHTTYFSKNHSLAYRGIIGMAYPYGNSNTIPFERRFFAGGSNSIRGWNTRSLGPGSYKGGNSSSNFVNQTGDIRMEFNIENRNKISKLFELAEFIDAGNVWTLKNYESQVGGKFDFAQFYKEIAISYGLGVRLDLDFLLLRVDFGMRAYDPAREPSDRFVVLRPRFRQDRFAWHFGIGYPF